MPHTCYDPDGATTATSTPLTSCKTVSTQLAIQVEYAPYDQLHAPATAASSLSTSPSTTTAAQVYRLIEGAIVRPSSTPAPCLTSTYTSMICAGFEKQSYH